MKSNSATIAKSISRRRVATFANLIIRILASVRIKMSDLSAKIPLITKRKKDKMDKYELRELVYSLAKEKHGNDRYAVLWGCASVLLSNDDLQVIANVLEKD
jgi:hypothetical protein